MRYLRTELATDFQTEPRGPSNGTIGISWFVASSFRHLDANPDYQLPEVRSWLIEFDDDGMPDREIGLNEHGEPVLAGPDDRNYGFWLDTNMKLADFTGYEISAEYFESCWAKASSQI